MRETVYAPCRCCRTPERFAAQAVEVLEQAACSREAREWLLRECGENEALARELRWIANGACRSDVERYFSLPGRRELLKGLILGAIS